MRQWFNCFVNGSIDLYRWTVSSTDYDAFVLEDRQGLVYVAQVAGLSIQKESDVFDGVNF